MIIRFALEKHQVLSKNCWGLFLGNFYKILGYDVFQNLVGLIACGPIIFGTKVGSFHCLPQT